MFNIYFVTLTLSYSEKLSTLCANSNEYGITQHFGGNFNHLSALNSRNMVSKKSVLSSVKLVNFVKKPRTGINGHIQLHYATQYDLENVEGLSNLHNTAQPHYDAIFGVH